ncbi:MAG: hypothetical protein SGPRY_012725 [Prymnesium sp.]
MCSHSCRASLSAAICEALLIHLPPSFPLPPSQQLPSLTRWLSPPVSTPLLTPRARLLYSEFACGDSPPALQQKRVLNGKSGSCFLVGGGPTVNSSDSRSYSLLLKQINPQESALLAHFHPRLVEHYSKRGGSLLAPLLGRLRYQPPDEEPFEAVLIENVARPPPSVSSGAVRPFDLKGIPLYAAERRLRATFGVRGLHVGAGPLKAMRAALQSDVDLLTSQSLVDYSYLLSVFPTSAPAQPCAKLARHVDYSSTFRSNPTLVGVPLFPAYFQLPSVTPANPTGSTVHASDEQANRSTAEAKRVEPAQLCVAVMVRPHFSPQTCLRAYPAKQRKRAQVRVGIIDYLREWRLFERVEHMKKTLVRCLHSPCNCESSKAPRNTHDRLLTNR